MRRQPNAGPTIAGPALDIWVGSGHRQQANDTVGHHTALQEKGARCGARPIGQVACHWQLRHMRKASSDLLSTRASYIELWQGLQHAQMLGPLKGISSTSNELCAPHANMDICCQQSMTVALPAGPMRACAGRRYASVPCRRLSRASRGILASLKRSWTSHSMPGSGGTLCSAQPEAFHKASRTTVGHHERLKYLASMNYKLSTNKLLVHEEQISLNYICGNLYAHPDMGISLGLMVKPRYSPGNTSSCLYPLMVPLAVCACHYSCCSRVQRAAEQFW